MIIDVLSPHAWRSLGVEGMICLKRQPKLRKALCKGPSSALMRLPGERMVPSLSYSFGASYLTSAKSMLKLARARVFSFVADTNEFVNLSRLDIIEGETHKFDSTGHSLWIFKKLSAVSYVFVESRIVTQHGDICLHSKATSHDRAAKVRSMVDGIDASLEKCEIALILGLGLCGADDAGELVA